MYFSRHTALLVLLCRLVIAALTPSGPFGGDAALIRVDPHTSRVVIAGTSNGQLFRSIDGGESWNRLPFPRNVRGTLHTLFLDPNVRNLYFAGVSGSEGSAGLLRSLDGGDSWEAVPDFENITVHAIAKFRGDSQVLAAGTDRGVFRSADGGVSWIRISPAANRYLQPVVSLSFDPKDRRVIYAGTPHLAWKTPDGGDTWRPIHAGMVDDSDIFSLMVDRNRRNRIFVGACSGLFRSVDGGSAWKKLASEFHRIYTVVQDPQHESILFAGSADGMLQSQDGGDTWTRILPYVTRSIAFDLRQLGRIYIATDGAGILRSDNNGNTWLEMNSGFCNRNLSRLAVDTDGSVYTAATGRTSGLRLFRLGSGANEWSEVDTFAQLVGETLIAVAASTAGIIYAATPTSLLMSSDSGTTWARAAAPSGKRFLTDLLSSPWEPGRIITLAGASVFVRGDDTAIWHEMELPDHTAISSVVALDYPWIAAIAGPDIFVSADGQSWRACTRMPGNATVYGVILVLTQQQGIFTAPLDMQTTSRQRAFGDHQVRE
jgi:photosystem II stability/assembly factor-like uncharacterized protein